MGLDTAEILFSVEDAFGITITDEEAASLPTPKALAELVADRVDALPDTDCVTRKIFYQVRGGFRQALPALAVDLRLQTPMKSVLHKQEWPQVWLLVRRSVGEDTWPIDIPWAGVLRDGPHTVRDLCNWVAQEVARSAQSTGARWTRQHVHHI